MQKYLNKNFRVYDNGLAVNPSHPYLGATPDGKVFDPMSASPFGLLEIKCPYAWRNHTMEAACDDVNFPCSIVDGVPKLWTDDKQGYYAQIQGQLALSGLRAQKYGHFDPRWRWAPFLNFTNIFRFTSEVSLNCGISGGACEQKPFWKI